MKNTFRILAIGITTLFGVSTLRAENVEQILRGGDSIVVKISGVPSEEIPVVSNSYDIADDGTINLPYTHQVKAAGLRPSQLQRNIEAAYKGGEIFTHPTIQVTASRDGNNTQVLFISGEVKTPGRITMSPAMTVHDAMTAAGGPTDFAKLKAVKLTRGGVTRVLDLRKADNPDASIPAQAGDKLHVPQ
jgi:protein involved in polysaccharide export with SLBB domain